MKKVQLISFLLLFAFAGAAQQMQVVVEGAAAFTASGPLVQEAGDNISASVESAATVMVSVLNPDYWDRNNNMSNKWRIHAHKSDISWNSNLQLEIRRTGTGVTPGKNSTPNVIDGDIYLAVSNTPTYFFRGMREAAFIPVQLKLTGFSLELGAAEYETSIVLTIYDDW